MRKRGRRGGGEGVMRENEEEWKERRGGEVGGRKEGRKGEGNARE